MVKFKSISDCQDYLRSKSLRQGFFFYNIEVSNRYFTLEEKYYTCFYEHSIEVHITLDCKNMDQVGIVLKDYSKRLF